MTVVLVERECCPVCNAPAPEPLLDLPYDSGRIAKYLTDFYGGRLNTTGLRGARYRIAQCSSCTLVYQVGVPTEPFLQHIYGDAALADPAHIARIRGLDVRRSYAHEIERFIIHFGGEPAAVSVLDFGSGTGLWLQMASAFGCRTSAAELSATGRERAHVAGHETWGPLELPESAFHYVNAEQVFEHLVDPATVLRNICRSLLPGGIVRINVPNGSDILDRLGWDDWEAPKGSQRSLNAIAPLEHVNCFSAHSLGRLGSESGLEGFRYPLRESVSATAPARHALSAIVHAVRTPNGTLQFFRRPP